MNEMETGGGLGASNAVYFSSGFNPRIQIPMSLAQSNSIFYLSHRLRKEGKHTQVDPGMPYGSFWIGGQERRWAKKYFFIPDKRNPGWNYVADDLLKKMSDGLEALGKDPFDFSSNDWNNVLSVLETEGK
jgi:hypothetical protein